MNNKGNILIIGLVLLNILLILSATIKSDLSQLVLFNRLDVNMEIMKIKVIQRIENEFKNHNEDFEFNENDIFVSATFDGLDYHVVIDGSYDYEMHITYDYVFECIESIEYFYE